ncbi:MAG: hypothetical protein IT381_22335 [Deltaproteobacteria bacterium]|nr:hypothetical protein [Deltaproteobacteria bacterium]
MTKTPIPEPTPEEMERARALGEFGDGGDPDNVPEDLAEMDALVAHLAHPPSKERLAALKSRVMPRARRPLWLVRGGVAAMAVAAAVLVVWFVRTPKSALPEPSAALLAAQSRAAKDGRVESLDTAMAPYRRSLLETPRLRAAEPVYARVDAALRAGELGAARAALVTFAESPPADLAVADARVLQRDALARLSGIEMRAGTAEAALAAANRGLALGRGEDVFTVNLLLARAAAHHALGHDKDEANDLYAALVIVDAMLEALLGGK